MLPYCLVEYDGSPDRYIEPLPILRTEPGGDNIRNVPLTQGAGLIVGFEVHRTRPFDATCFDDVDVNALSI